MSHTAIRKKCLSGLRIEVVECDDWRLRSLLECYGCAIEQPLFDLEAEH